MSKKHGSGNGHGIMINMGSYLPFVFTFNPLEVETTRTINYEESPNIGGSHHELFFTGFSNKEASFDIICIDMEDPMGVNKEIAYFEALRSPDPELLGIAGSFFGNDNYPPPQVLFNFGTGSIMPLMWDVTDISIQTSLFYAGHIRGVYGIPKRVDIGIKLSLDQDNVLYKSDQIFKKVQQIQGSVMSVMREGFTKKNNTRQEQPGIWKLKPNSKEW